MKKTILILVLVSFTVAGILTATNTDKKINKIVEKTKLYKVFESGHRV